MKDIAEDQEGDQEQQTMQRLLKIHKNLGHPSNKLLVQILKVAKAPTSVVDLAVQLHCPICARHVATAPAS